MYGQEGDFDVTSSGANEATKLHHSLALLCLFSSAAAHKILVYNPKFAYSHVNFLGRVADILADAGHDVTTLQPEMLPSIHNGTSKSRIVTVPQSTKGAEAFKEYLESQIDYFTYNALNPLNIWKAGQARAKTFTSQCETTLDSGVIEQLRKEQFAVYIVETYDPCGMMLAHLIKPRSVILQSTLFLWMQQLDEVGIPRTLSYNPSLYTEYLDVNSFWSRLMNVVTDAMIAERIQPARRQIAALFKERFGEDYPSLSEQTSRVTWVFTNAEPLYDFAVPTLHKVVPVPGLGARDPKPLDEYWSGVVKKRSKTAIISFGTIAKLNVMQPAFKQSFVKLFNAFPHITFVLKYDDLEDEFATKKLSKLDNVVLTKWMPQNDLLADPRVVLFITHCGMGSVQELTLRGKPGVFIPLFLDQMRNAFMLEQSGNGVHIHRADVAVPEKFIGAVKEVLENEKYTRKAIEIRKMLEGKPYSAKELLLKHVQFAGEFGATAVMRPRSHDMNWIEYQNADVWLFIVSSISLLALLASFLLLSLVYCVFLPCGSCDSTVYSEKKTHYSTHPSAWGYKEKQ